LIVTKDGTYRLAIAVSLAVVGVLAALASIHTGTVPVGQRVHVAIQTCGALVLCIAAALVFKRFHGRAAGSRAPQRLADVLLAAALGLLALTTVLFSALPAVMTAHPGAFAIWSQVLGQMLGMGVAVLAAWIPATWVIRRRVNAAQTIGLIAAGMLLVTLAALAASRLLHTPAARPATLQTDWLPTELILLGLIAVAFVGFARRANRDGDRLMRGLAVACPMGAGAVITYAVGPGLSAAWIVVEELFLLAAYGAVLAGAWTESAAYWDRFVERAAAEQRRRLARDIHDGLAQDLVYIATQVRALADRHPDAAGLHRLLYASEHALEESRGAIGTLTCSPGEPLGRALVACVRDVADRAGVAASVRVEGDVELSVEARETVLRIAREATSNAVRHGRASRVVVILQCADTLRLTVSDDGIAFDPEAAQREERGFGLRSMQERARVAGGSLSIRSDASAGTEVTATMPRDRDQLSLAG